MRLINTTTLEFSEFFDNAIPEYVILSHRWGSDEASFKDFEKGIQHTRSGFGKIRGFCNLALKSQYDWAWVDTCCIDKSSSAELTEAINSMYRWYENARVCFVYLADVSWRTTAPALQQASMMSFRASNWFTRGWTLQELLAPQDVRFNDRTWGSIGTKVSLIHEISELTNIDVQYLSPHQNIEVEPCSKSPDCRAHSGREPSIATRMSWVSRRQTSRTEDMAYCLLGIFDVNMPLLYGEGRKAFRRLQYEILKQSDDESIFAWASQFVTHAGLAFWPTDFRDSRYVHRWGPISNERRPYSMTNQGLSFPITWRTHLSEHNGLRVLLDCCVCGPQGLSNLELRLRYLRPGVWLRLGVQFSAASEQGLFHNPLRPGWRISKDGSLSFDDVAEARGVDGMREYIERLGCDAQELLGTDIVIASSDAFSESVFRANKRVLSKLQNSTGGVVDKGLD
ncbi:MAG: hypothetical protein LQ348_000961 [Seirophora lacunosa]|nr:MAG: hypothetical protein LQ344_008018 [Seirophora lacunosa]KAI4206484.1 MAG: hypothetical protein LQ348_000961 [Seirophora lacunosa]